MFAGKDRRVVMRNWMASDREPLLRAELAQTLFEPLLWQKGITNDVDEPR